MRPSPFSPTLLLILSACGPPANASPPEPPVFLTDGVAADSMSMACVGDAESWRSRDEIEPHVASSPADPDHLVAAWMLRAPGGPGAVQAAASRDGGRTWSRPATLAFGECSGGPAGAHYVSDPWVTLDDDGRAYVAAIGWEPGADEDEGDAGSILQVAVSEYGGERWSVPVAVSDLARSGVNHDNTAIASVPGSPGVAFLTTTRYLGDSGPAGVARTDDGGRHWTPLAPTPVPGPDAPWALAPQPLTGARSGELWVVFGHDPHGAHIAVIRSEDDGQSWSSPRPVASWDPPDGWLRYPGTDSELELAPDIVSSGIDRASGTLWVAYMAPGPNGAPTIRLARSGDGGLVWQSAEVSPAGRIGWRPTMAVAPRGMVAVSWFRPDSVAAEPAADGIPSAANESSAGAGVRLPTAVELAWLRVDTDGATRVAARARLDRFDWTPRRAGNFFLGDYHGLTVARDAAVAVFSRSTPDGIRVVAVRAPIPDPETAP